MKRSRCASWLTQALSIHPLVLQDLETRARLNEPLSMCLFWSHFTHRSFHYTPLSSHFTRLSSHGREIERNPRTPPCGDRSILQNLGTRARLNEALSMRLLKTAPYMTSWPQALALQAIPTHAPGTSNLNPKSMKQFNR